MDPARVHAGKSHEVTGKHQPDRDALYAIKHREAPIRSGHSTL
jgi:hypothetical protein